ILRAHYDVAVNKDGTTRYDMSEIPITHFKLKEIGTSVEKIKELGYGKDIHGVDITNKEQIIELKPQDMILPGGHDTLDGPATDVLTKVANFVDDELTILYGLDHFYDIKTYHDLVGHLVIGLAPHISAGTVGRIIGFSQTAGMFCHPLYHAAMRRDCDGDESCVMLLMDAFLNFSRQFLPDNRGGRTMDAPLVLTAILNPSEVDDMVHKLDIAWQYPLQFYELCQEITPPTSVDIERLGSFLGTPRQYEGMGFTHDTTDINDGAHCSAYKTLPTIDEKVFGQMKLAKKIRAVDTSDVARLVIEKHFMKDTRGNLRKFSMQKFRCVGCNESYRRTPLIGKCTKCGGKLIFTISEGSIIKYLDTSIHLAETYDCDDYLKDSLYLIKFRLECMFGKEKEKQVGLDAFS
ncbi:MAG TPA: DNA polymerase II large subunit, partial [Candidatus Nanoarchaeia archaeon]|nr:DNA polymerase II large subunit [Candidatus Nanoarchaeia archaeon]